MPPKKARKAPVKSSSRKPRKQAATAVVPLPSTAPSTETSGTPLWKVSTCVHDWGDLCDKNSFAPRPFQVATAELFLGGGDLLLSAPTGAGKGKILEMLCAAERKKTWMVIVPLKALEVELTVRLGKIATYVNSEHKDKPLLDDIQDGKYQMVFLSVEMAASRRMQDIFSYPGFASRLAGLVVDEAHTITDWGTKDFRGEYRHLGHLKNVLHTKVLAMSATLSKDHIVDIQHVLEMKPGTPHINVGTDRPNLELRIWPMRHSTKDLLDLLYTMPDLAVHVQPEYQYPGCPDRLYGEAFRDAFTTTYIYHSNKDANCNMKDVIAEWFKLAGLTGVVATYCADDSEGHKRRVVEMVRSGEILCVICTDALGMGSDVKKVGRVVQWRLDLTTTISEWWQRIGRAARDFATTGIAYLIVQPSLLPADIRALVARTGNPSYGNNVIMPDDSKATDSKQDKERRAKANQPMMALLVEVLGSGRCIRRLILRFLNQPKIADLPDYSELYTASTGTIPLRALQCCHSCSDRAMPPRLTDAVKKASKRARNGLGELRDELEAALRAWRRSMWLGEWEKMNTAGFASVNQFFSTGHIADILQQLGCIVDDIVDEDLSESVKFNEKFKPNNYLSPEDPLEQHVADGLLEVLKDVILKPQQTSAAHKKAQAAQTKADKDRKKAEKQAKQAEQDIERAKDVEAGRKKERGCGRCGTYNQRIGFRFYEAVGHDVRRLTCPSRNATPQDIEVIAAAARLGSFRKSSQAVQQALSGSSQGLGQSQ